MLIENLVVEHLDEVALQGLGDGSGQANKRVVHNFKITPDKPDLSVCFGEMAGCWKFLLKKTLAH